MKDKLKEIKDYVDKIWDEGYIPVGVYADFMNILGVNIEDEDVDMLEVILHNFSDYDFIDKKTKKMCIAAKCFDFNKVTLYIQKYDGDIKHPINKIEDLDKIGVKYIRKEDEE